MREDVDIKKALSELDSDERSALLFGFPMPPTDSFDGLEPDLYDADNRMSVDGDWKPYEEMSNFADDEYSDFLTKKSRAREKLKRKKRKALRGSGLSRGDARRQARKEALDEIPKDKLKDIAKRTFSNIGNAIKKGALALPRGAYLSLLRINYRGNAWKIMSIHTGTDATLKTKLKNKWEKLGGNYSKLISNASKGKGKKPFFCGAKCKKALLHKDLKKSFDGNFEIDDMAFYSLEPATITAIVGTAGAILGAMAGIVNNAQVGKQQEKQIEAEKELQQKSLDAMTDTEKRQVAFAEKQLQAQADPIQQILNNPNLTDAEKREAIALTKDALKSERGAKIKKWLVIGGLGIVALGIITYIVKKK